MSPRILCCLLAAFLVACPEDDDPAPDGGMATTMDASVSGDAGVGGDATTMAGTGQVQGRLTPFSPGAASRHRRTPKLVKQAANKLLREAKERDRQIAVAPSWRQPLASPRWHPAPPAKFVLGEVIVVLRGELPDLKVVGAQAGLHDYELREGAWGGVEVLTVRFRDRANPSRPIRADETRRLRGVLAAHEAFAAAELNYLKYPLATPNDPGYAAQWHYPQINLPAAWDVTTGSDTVVIAVIDDGVRAHTDLTRRIDGYDMISAVANGGDGDGRDADGSAEPNPSPLGKSSWHGNHVAGTVGATSGNNAGLAGVDWSAKLLPVRVLGVQGTGEAIDIIAGMRWAAGLEVPGVPMNPTPAHVLNMSLGGGPLTDVEQMAINEVVNTGAVIVVASGNSNEDAAQSSLGGYDNVIVVGATDYNQQRAPYSNFGTVIDIMAPGGDTQADANADGKPDGVLSTYLDDTGMMSGTHLLDGTSMASPHIAGIVGLMKAVNPQLDHAMAEQILKSTANPASQCNQGCGAGQVNAAAAVLAARGMPPASGPKVALSAPRLNAGGEASAALSIFNQGGAQLDWTATITGRAAMSVRIDGAASGAIAPGGAHTLRMAIDRTGLADGAHQATLNVAGNGGTVTAGIIFRVGAAPRVDVGAIVVATVVVDENDDITEGGSAMAMSGDSYTYQLDSPTGEWFVIALADKNGNDELDAGDMWGIYKTFDQVESVQVAAGGSLTNIDFALVPYEDGGEETATVPCGDYRGCIEACAGDEMCEDACVVSQACDDCFTSTVDPCGTANACNDDFGCLCGACVDELDACFGPLLCEGGAAAPLGSACDATTSCEDPYECSMAVPGGICSRDCSMDFNCPGGECLEVDLDGDMTADGTFCLAVCDVDPCPRATDVCVDDGAGGMVCVP